MVAGMNSAPIRMPWKYDMHGKKGAYDIDQAQVKQSSTTAFF